MNCKFCGNFTPDGADSCPVCGRRQDEQAIGKLLSENMPNPVAAENQREEAQRRRNSEGNDTNGKSKSLIPPLSAIALAVLGWLYGLTQDIFGDIRLIYNGAFGKGVAIASDSDVVVGKTAMTNDVVAMIFLVLIVVLLTVVGVIGAVALVKRLISKFKK